jgi:PIN domain nuclease of toxin-antitoxin system
MSEVVLDSSAMLALLGNERGADKVQAALPGALLSTVNLAEVIAKLVERGMPAEEVHDLVRSVGVEIVDFAADQAVNAGELRSTTRAAGLSLGDRACLALARMRNLPAVTADSAWRLITHFDIRFIR